MVLRLCDWLTELPGQTNSPDTKLISLRIEHYCPACSIAFSLFHHRGTKADHSLNLSLRFFRREIDVYAALRCFGLRNLPEQDSSDASLVWCRQCGEVIPLNQRYIAGDF